MSLALLELVLKRCNLSGHFLLSKDELLLFALDRCLKLPALCV